MNDYEELLEKYKKLYLDTQELSSKYIKVLNDNTLLLMKIQEYQKALNIKNEEVVQEQQVQEQQVVEEEKREEKKENVKMGVIIPFPDRS